MLWDIRTIRLSAPAASGNTRGSNTLLSWVSTRIQLPWPGWINSHAVQTQTPTKYMTLWSKKIENPIWTSELCLTPHGSVLWNLQYSIPLILWLSVIISSWCLFVIGVKMENKSGITAPTSCPTVCQREAAHPFTIWFVQCDWWVFTLSLMHLCVSQTD